MLQFPLLTTERYQDAQETAKRLIRERAEEPAWKTFEHRGGQVYPRWFTGVILVALIGVMIFSFTISAGKQIASASMLFDPLPDKFNHLSTLWSSTSIAFMLLLSEFGSVLFLVAAGTLAHDAARWRGVNVVALMFRLFAALCAGYAVVSNVSVTLLDPVPSVGVLQWLTSIGIPITVLGLGTLLERMVVESLKARGKQKVEFEIALRDYQALLADPTKHESWGQIITSTVFEEMIRLKRNREAIDIALAQYGDTPRTKAAIVAAEMKAHEAHDALSVEVSSNPFLETTSPAQLPLRSSDN